MFIQELKKKSPDELLALAEEHQIENPSAMLKQDMIFAILKKMAEKGVPYVEKTHTGRLFYAKRVSYN